MEACGCQVPLRTVAYLIACRQVGEVGLEGGTGKRKLVVCIDMCV